MNPKITSFDEKNFPQIVDFVKPMWSSSDWEDSFRRFYSEIILQNSYFKNDLAFQITEDKNPQKLNAAIFFEKPTDKNNLNQWILDNSSKFTPSQTEVINLGKEYLFYMDSKVHSLMTNNDIKLSLFVGLEKGFGSIIFTELWNYLKSQGYKNMFLWTDCECNWKWYKKEGFTLVEESTYEKFRTPNNQYNTYIFKKKII